jgi:phosphoribosyl 1,2-cyclic phosphate phosphodiesterase
MNLKVTVLGCGNSTGVPAVGNFWGACDPLEPKNRRSRPSIAVRSAKTTIIIDTGTDFREQMNRANIPTLDAVLYTHAHGDHVSGIDDLRLITYRNKKMTPVFSNQETILELQRRFHYLFEGGGHKLYPPVLEPHILSIDDCGKLQTIGDISYQFADQDHGTCRTLGFRFGSFAYSTDILDLDHSAIEILKGIDTWMVDCAAYKDPNNSVHANLDRIFALNGKIGAKTVYLTSLSLSMDYQTLVNELPGGYAPAFDGLEFSAKI